MRVVSVSRIVNEWIDEIAALHCISEFPSSVRKNLFYAGIGSLERYGPKRARYAIWRRIATWADKEAKVTWFDLVKSPIPAFLETRR